MSGIGFVIQANAPIDQAATEALVRAVNSPRTSHTVVNNPGYAAHLKANVAPSSHFYLRNYDEGGDEDDWKTYSPDAYFNKYQAQVLGKGLGLQVCNEPGFDPPQINALIQFMLEAERRNIPISIGGFSIGTPPDSADGWGRYDAFVQHLCRRPDLFTFDCHEYGIAVPTSGAITSETQEGEALYFAKKLLRKEQWPQSFGTMTNNYHIGRIRHLFEYVKRKGYATPAVDIGECLIDFVSDVREIDAWGKGLPSTNPNKSIGHVRGYKSYGVYWPQAVAPGQSVQETYVDMLTWAREVVYDALGVRSMRVFCVGNSGKPNTTFDWCDFDWNTDPAMRQTFLERVGKPATPAQPSVPKLPIFPADFASRAVAAKMSAKVGTLSVRAMPVVTSALVARLDAFEREGLYIPLADLQAGETAKNEINGVEGVWLPVEVGSVQGWVFEPYLRVKPAPSKPAEPSGPSQLDIQRLYNLASNIGTLVEDLKEQLAKLQKG